MRSGETMRSLEYTTSSLSSMVIRSPRGSAEWLTERTTAAEVAGAGRALVASAETAAGGVVVFITAGSTTGFAVEGGSCSAAMRAGTCFARELDGYSCLSQVKRRSAVSRSRASANISYVYAAT